MDASAVSEDGLSLLCPYSSLRCIHISRYQGLIHIKLELSSPSKFRELILTICPRWIPDTQDIDNRTIVNSPYFSNVSSLLEAER
jgi:hypothetical protein